MGVYKYKVNGEWQRNDDGDRGYTLSWRDEHGKRHRKTYWGTKQRAKLKLQKIEEEVEARKHGPSDTYLRKKGELPLSDFFKEHKQHLQEKNASPRTIDTYDLAVRKFKEYIGDLPLNEISRKRLLEFQKKRKQDVKSGTVSNNLKSLRVVLNFAVKKGYLKRTPFYDIDLRIDKRGRIGERLRWLSLEEIQQIYTAVRATGNSDAEDLLTMYLYSGARAKEILPANNFTWNNIRPRLGQICLYGAKTDKERWIPLTAEVEEVLKKRKEKLSANCKYPFPYNYDKAYDMLVRNIIKKIDGLDDVSLQTLRRTTGMLLLEAGRTIFEVSEYLGHSDVRVTKEWYVGLTNTNRKEMGQQLGNLMGNITTQAQEKPVEQSAGL